MWHNSQWNDTWPAPSLLSHNHSEVAKVWIGMEKVISIFIWRWQSAPPQSVRLVIEKVSEDHPAKCDWKLLDSYPWSNIIRHSCQLPAWNCDRSNTGAIFSPSEIRAGYEMGDINKSWLHCTGGDTVWTTLGQLHHPAARSQTQISFLWKEILNW